ncbi:MAG: hypothetical protein JKY53_07490 [Flavobacteriales bacterium]|nr:hypothetical protein [Flavobacteriales bacterium]
MFKTVLSGVSFDKSLFKKELRKAKIWLKKDELAALKVWCITTFGIEYHHLVNDVLSINHQLV